MPGKCFLLRFLTLFGFLTLSSCLSFNRNHWQSEEFLLKKFREKTEGKMYTVEEVAAAIDHLERWIDTDGSVIPMQASVFGEARLMAHRQDIERELHGDLSKFDDTIQGYLQTTDQAYLAMALSISADTTPSTAGGTSPPPSSSATSSKTKGLLSPALSTGGQTYNVTVNTAGPASKSTSPSSQTNDASTLIPASKDVYNITQTTLGKTPTNSDGSTPRLGLEPVIHLSQKMRYLNFLNELRRINEGDDNSESSGYRINLVRIPISVITGSQTQRGYGAECTITIKPHLPEDLLSKTFQNWVVNDIINNVTLPIVSGIDNVSEQKLKSYLDSITTKTDRSTLQPEWWKPLVKRKAIQASAQVTSPLGNTMLIELMGYDNVAKALLYCKEQLKDHLAAEKRAYHLDVQDLLRQELNLAYDLLKTPAFYSLWEYASENLAQLIHQNNFNQVEQIRKIFQNTITTQLTNAENKEDQNNLISIRSSAAWVIVMSAALLNDRLMKDMRETQSTKSWFQAPEHWVPFYLPCPSPEINQLFNEYVKVRWPIYVFNIDPQTDDQNILDSLTTVRDLRIALAVAFTNGVIGVSQFTSFARRLQQDYETVAIHRSSVGFSNGTDTFGWRFYPRFQTPPILSNSAVLFQTLFSGLESYKQKLRQSHLENGIRECDALIVMPAIIPYIDLEYTSNWFRLPNPKFKRATMQQTMTLSRVVQSIRKQQSRLR